MQEAVRDLTCLENELEAFAIESMKREGHVPGCRKGCINTYCCSLIVTTGVLEGYRIATWLHEHAPTFLAEHEAEILNLAKLVVAPGMNAHVWAERRQPCIFHDGHCRVYPVRPMPCRHYHGGDPQTCGTPTGRTFHSEQLQRVATEMRVQVYDYYGFRLAEMPLSLAVLLGDKLRQGIDIDAWFSENLGDLSAYNVALFENLVSHEDDSYWTDERRAKVREEIQTSGYFHLGRLPV